MPRDDRSWMLLPRSSNQWMENLRIFLENTFTGTSRGGTALCPCARCRCMASRSQYMIRSHLLARGFDDDFISEGQSAAAGASPNLLARGSDYDFNREGKSSAVGVNPHIGDNEGSRHTEDVGLHNDEDAPPQEGGANNLIRSLIRGAIHGEIRDVDNEEPNQHAKIFFKLLKDAEKELYPGCTGATKVSFILELFQLKCMYGISNSALEGVLNLFSRMLPKGHCIPETMEKVQRVVRDLGLDYVKIHACLNDCVLFWKENANLDACPTCGVSRWKTVPGAAAAAEKGVTDGASDGTNKKRLPHKILRYFPLIPRLQRLYMSESTSSYMQWHKEGLVNDGKMRHPADSKAWKHVDTEYSLFASDARNVRLGLASDGFNPFGMQNVTYTTWPVILIPYNLPPWLCQKQAYWMMSMLIPGPKSPGMSIDVYLRPLIDELNVLWENGVQTWDAKVTKNFSLHAVLLWTVNDFPAYAMLSGWSTKGKFACPYCHKDTDYLWLKFGGKHC